MPRRPPYPGFVDLNGQPVTPEALLERLRARQAESREAAAAPASERSAAPAGPLDEGDVARVLDALCLAGAPRGKTWVAHFLRALEWRAHTGTRALTVDEVGRALHQLAERGQAHRTDAQGWRADAVARAQRWPALWRHADAPRFWSAWAWAGSGGYGPVQAEPMHVPLRVTEDAEALLRLVLLARPALAHFERLLAGPLRQAFGFETLLLALSEPFDAEFLAALDPALLWAMVLQLEDAVPDRLAATPALAGWIDAQMLQRPQDVPPMMWLHAAERGLLAGRPDAARAALARLDAADPACQLMQALLVIHAGDFAAGSAAVADALKACAKAVGKRNRLAPERLLRWQALALLAKPEVAAWTAARKFALAESGSRTPSPHDSWGRIAHVAAVRLGDGTLNPGVFALPGERWHDRQVSEDDAMRLVLAAWLGQPPEAWPAARVAQLHQALHQQGQVWLADLLGQACARLGWPVPARPAGAPPPWPVAFYPAPAEGWREALAAIAALDPLAADATAPQPLHWRLTLDAAGRPHDLQVFERQRGGRHAGRLKPLTLTALKNATRLDPRDAAVARCLRHAAWDRRTQWLDLAGAAAALVGHPDLALADAPEQALQLVEGVPTVELRRERQPDGSEGFRLYLDDLRLDGAAPPSLAHHWGGSTPAEEIARRESVRVLRDAPDRARLVRITAAQRRVAELARKPWAVPVAAEAELGAALRALTGHFTVHSDAAAGRSVPADARLVAQLTPRGAGVLQLRLGVRPFAALQGAGGAGGAGAAAQPPVGPLLPPGAGRTRLLVQHAGEALNTTRDLAAERAGLAALCDALPFLGEPETDAVSCGWTLDEPELALATLEVLGRHPAVAALEWPQGQPLRVLSPPDSRLPMVVNASGHDWLGVDATLRVDEHTVLGLKELLALLPQARGGRFVPLGEHAWLALTERLRQQLADLADLAAMAEGAAAGAGGARRGRQAAAAGVAVPAAAAGWLADQFADAAGAAPAGDRAWQQRVQRLAAAAALAPEPPPALQATLRPYQAEGFAWLVQRGAAGFGAVLADDMGLGKTLQTLALLLHRAAEGPALVVAPTSVVANWAAEAARFAPALQVRDYAAGREAALADAGAGDLVLVSYGLLLRDAEAFAARDWGTLVLDEAQALKNAATQRAQAVAGLRAGARLALSGTPVENRLADLWSLMNLLNPGLLGSAQRFAERFGNPIERQRDEAARQRLKRLVAPFVLRRTKAQVLDDLPPRTEIVHRIEPGEDERALGEALRRAAVERVGAAAQGGGHAAVQVLAELTRLRRAACDPRLVLPDLDAAGLQQGGAKLQAIEALVQELAAGRHQTLLFSQFTDFLDRIAERLDAVGIAWQRLDGSTPAAARGERVAAFQRGEGQVFLISLKAGGMGLNLTAADYVIIADPWWNPAAEDQASGRAHRIGQQRPVTVYRLVLAGSVEERIVALHHDKRALAEGLLDGGEGAAAPLDADALLALLRG